MRILLLGPPHRWPPLARVRCSAGWCGGSLAVPGWLGRGEDVCCLQRVSSTVTLVALGAAPPVGFRLHLFGDLRYPGGGVALHLKNSTAALGQSAFKMQHQPVDTTTAPFRRCTCGYGRCAARTCCWLALLDPNSKKKKKKKKFATALS